jgi:MFS transporter, OPA family, glycerol-3-phosphate transporter
VPAVASPIAHSDAFRLRRFLNWFPLGLAYAFLYMGRYNLTVAKGELGQLMTNEDFGIIFGAGALVYGVAFVINGPLTDTIGGKRAMLISVAGTAIMNIVMGLVIWRATASGASGNLRGTFTALYAANMYFQSFGAVAIVKVNAHWFHVRERGGFSGIFGTMISSGIFLAFTVNSWIISLVKGDGPSRAVNAMWVFFGPAALLVIILVVELLLLKDRPSQAGHEDFDTGDASSGEAGDVRLSDIMRRIFTNPIILTVAFIEFCTGVLRQGIMHWYPFYAKEVLGLPNEHYMRNGSWGNWWLVAGLFAVAIVLFVAAKMTKGKGKGTLYVTAGLIFLAPFVQGGWGGILFVAGVIGGNVAGWVSDLFFQSRRAPAAGGLYLVLALAAGAMYFVLGGTTSTVSWTGSKDLQQGDRIVAVAGKPTADWQEVQRAVACYPAQCTGGARFDAGKCACTSSTSVVEQPVTTDGTIPARISRGGVEQEVKLADPAYKKGAWTMRAGDTRKLKAGPALTLSPFFLGFIAFLMSTCVIGTHGLLSGTATMDFGGRKGAATAVGMIDGFVYLGTAVQSFALGYLTSKDWSYWPLFLVPFAIIGFILCTRIWHAKPAPRGGGH